MINNNKSSEKISAVVVEDALIQEDNQEAKIEVYFYNFVQEIIKNSSSKEPNFLTCTDFEDCNMVFTFILQLFNGNNKAKEQLAKNNSYESNYLTLVYTEKNDGNSFARLKLTFKKKEETPTYTIIFRSTTK